MVLSFHNFFWDKYIKLMVSTKFEVSFILNGFFFKIDIWPAIMQDWFLASRASDCNLLYIAVWHVATFVTLTTVVFSTAIRGQVVCGNTLYFNYSTFSSHDATINNIDSSHWSQRLSWWWKSSIRVFPQTMLRSVLLLPILVPAIAIREQVDGGNPPSDHFWIACCTHLGAIYISSYYCHQMAT